MVSVVIPVYNVEAFLDKCLGTVVGQTCRDIEILLINDGSTDGSAALCEKWAAEDARIRYFSKSNEGLGPTRNFGLRHAQGEYVLFLDSDDWWELNAVEVLLNAATAHNADIVYMNFYYSEYEDGVLVERPFIRRNSLREIPAVTDPRGYPELVFDMDARMWSKMFRKSLFLDNGIWMPAHPYEDLPVMPLLAACAETVCRVEDILYHYYYTRPGNIIGVADNRKYIFASIRELYDAFGARGLTPRYGESLRDYIIGMAKFALNEMKGDRQRYIDELRAMYPDWDPDLDMRLVVWGSYNSLLAARNVAFLNSQVREHYMFSSLVSAMEEQPFPMGGVAHKNPFRMQMVQKDLCRSFLNNAETVLAGASFVLVDFLEEISDVMEAHGTFCTLSEAHREAGLPGAAAHRALALPTPERTALWQAHCLAFIRTLQRFVPPHRVLLLKQKLCRVHGARPGDVHPFDDTGWIDRANAALDDCYAFFAQNFPGIAVLETNVDGADYTYTYTQYGCLPQYSNGIQHKTVAGRVLGYIHALPQNPAQE